MLSCIPSLDLCSARLKAVLIVHATALQEEWIDLCRENRNRRVQLLPPGGDRSAWPPPPPPPVPAPAAPQQGLSSAPAGGHAAGEQPDGGAPQGAAAVGRRVGVWLEANSCFYYGMVGGLQAAVGQLLMRNTCCPTPCFHVERCLEHSISPL